MNKKILAIGAMAALLIATLPAYGENASDTNKAYAAGFGAAVDDSNDMHRSKVLFLLKIITNDTEKRYEVMKGFLTIKFAHERDSYKAIPETWSVIVNGTGFFAEGKMIDNKGEEHTVAFEGELLADTNQGELYIIRGTLDDEYNLYYLLDVVDLDEIKLR